MILFKRVRGAFGGIEGREWALLFLETVGVVAGILIAFELNEWASRRNEASQRHNQLERLLAEAEFNVASLREERKAMGRFGERERAFAVMLVHDGQCPPPEAWAALSSVRFYPALQISNGVYDELMGTGGLSTIENEHVRNSVSEFHAALDFYNSQNDYFRQRRVDPVSDDDPRARLDFDPNADEPVVASYDRPALCKDRIFRNKVATAVRNHQTLAVHGASDLMIFAVKMCVAIAQNLGVRCVPAFGGPLAGADAKLVAETVAKTKAGKD